MFLELLTVHYLHCMLAIYNPDIHKVAAYEPLFYLGQPELDLLESTMHRFGQEVAEGKMADAMVTGIKGAQQPKSIYWLPRFLLTSFSKIALIFDARNVKGDDVPLQGAYSHNAL